MTVKPVIHVGIDSSWRDTGALEWALQESLVRHEPLQVVHVVDEQKRRVPGWEHSVDESSMDFVTEVQRYLDEIPGTLDNEADAQLLVVGGRHHTRVASVLLGSVTRGVLHHAACPLAVVPPAVVL